MKNWKTSLMGGATIFAVVAKIIGGGQLGMEDIAAITAGVGLLTAKDFDKSHTQP